VERETLLGVEDGDGGRQLIERADMRVHLPLQVGAHGLELGHVDGDAGAAAARRRAFRDVEDAARACNDGGDPRLHGQAFGAPPMQLLPGGAVEQFDRARLHAFQILRIDGGHVGAVGPNQAPLRIAQPNRLLDAVEQPAQRRDFARRSPKLLTAAQEVEPLAGHVPQAQKRLTVERAAFRLDKAVRHRPQGQMKALASAAQRGHGALQRRRVGRKQP
jgi:hypothetical protein